jgi:hypothetical protein
MPASPSIGSITLLLPLLHIMFPLKCVRELAVHIHFTVRLRIQETQRDFAKYIRKILALFLAETFRSTDVDGHLFPLVIMTLATPACFVSKVAQVRLWKQIFSEFNISTDFALKYILFGSLIDSNFLNKIGLHCKYFILKCKYKDILHNFEHFTEYGKLDL